jgi:hypothetical protein
MGFRSIELDCWDTDEHAGIRVVHGKEIPLLGLTFVSTSLEFTEIVCWLRLFLPFLLTLDSLRSSGSMHSSQRHIHLYYPSRTISPHLCRCVVRTPLWLRH